jgi:hypothetical protein
LILYFDAKNGHASVNGLKRQSPEHVRARATDDRQAGNESGKLVMVGLSLPQRYVTVEGENAMRYLLMCHFNEKLWAKIPESQRSEIMQEYGKFVQGIVKSGHYRAGAMLQLSSTAATVRENNGKRVITDGPFAETKEQFGGYHLVECKDLDEAVAIATCIPTIRVGGSIEVRALLSESEG